MPGMKMIIKAKGCNSGLQFTTITTLKDAGLITAVIGKGYYVAGT